MTVFHPSSAHRIALVHGTSLARLFHPDAQHRYLILRRRSKTLLQLESAQRIRQKIADFISRLSTNTVKALHFDVGMPMEQSPGL